MIFDKVTWVSQEEAKMAANPLLDLVNQWRKAWESKDVDTYINFYDPEFKSGKMNLKKWRRYKKDLAALYNNIQIHLSMPVIFEHKDTAVVRFYQNYTSSGHQDFGEKTLYMWKKNGQYKILNEAWQEATKPEVKNMLSGDNLCCHLYEASTAPNKVSAQQ
jgi:murein L,D-transpeptidase YafK